MHVGDRVQLSELGASRAPKSRGKRGVVIKTKSSSREGPLDVLFDGNSRPTRIHSSYLETAHPRGVIET